LKLAVYTGSFDPITLGHLNVIERAAGLTDKLIVGIGINVDKKGLFDPEQRIALATKVISHLDNVSVQSFEGLAVDFVESDTAGEFTMMMANRKLSPNLETVFLMSDGKYAHVSSSLIKQLTPLATDEQLAEFVPNAIISELRKKLAAKQKDL